MKEEPRGQEKILFWVITGLVALASVLVFWPFLSAFLWATVLAVLMWPLYARLSAKLSKNFSALIATLVTGFVIVLPFAGIGAVAGVQVYQFTNQMTQQGDREKSTITVDGFAQNADAIVGPILAQAGVKDFHIKEYISTNRAQITSAIRGPITNLAKNLVETAITLIMALLTMFFFLRDGPKLLGPACEFVPLPADETRKIIKKMQETIQSVFVGVVLVSIIQSTIGGLTYWILGVPNPWLWAFLTFIFCTVPMVGGPVVYVPLAIKLMIDGKTPQAIVLLVIGFGVISTVDNFLRPVFIGARSDLHPMAIFFSLLGGVLLVGPIGIMAGPMIITVLLALIDVIRTRRKLEDERVASLEAMG